MKKETPAKKLADAIERGDKYKDLMLHFNREATRCQSCLHQVAQERDNLRTKYTLAMLEKEALGAKLSEHPWRLAEAASDLAQERLRHQATKRLIPVVAFVSSAIGAVLLTAFMWLTRWAP